MGARIRTIRPEFFQHEGRSLRQEALSKIKAEVVRIGTNGTRKGFKLAEAMFRAYPELRKP